MTWIPLLTILICPVANFFGVESWELTESDSDYESFVKLDSDFFVEPKSRSGEETPESFSWVERGAVTEPRDEGNCDTCWAFSITGAFEGALFVDTKKLKALSPQNIIDCFNVSGIDPALGRRARGFKYVEKHGLQLESDYRPYSPTCEAGKCQFDPEKSVLRVKVIGHIPSEDERLTHYLRLGPISVGIFMTEDLRKKYKGGIYNDPSCNNQPENNHAALLVGYGVENGQKFWLLKSSWGTGWGEKGYFRLTREVPNSCGINKNAVMPFLLPQ